MKIYIYNQNCVNAGRAVPQRFIEQHDDPDNAGDWTLYEGSEDELIEQAISFIKQAKTAGAGNDLYLRLCARTILENLLWGDGKIDRFIKHHGIGV